MKRRACGTKVQGRGHNTPSTGLGRASSTFEKAGVIRIVSVREGRCLLGSERGVTFAFHERPPRVLRCLCGNQSFKKCQNRLTKIEGCVQGRQRKKDRHALLRANHLFRSPRFAPQVAIFRRPPVQSPDPKKRICPALSAGSQNPVRYGVL